MNYFIKPFNPLIDKFISLLSSLLKTHKDFSILFFRKEGKELLGKNWSNFWVLSAILFITFAAIGFSNGSLIYLERKMSDPFINWVYIKVQRDEIKDSKSRDISQIIDNDLDTEAFKNKYFYKTITGYYKHLMYFFTQNKNNEIIIRGRTISRGDSILNAVFSKKNYIKGRTFNSDKDIGLIVTSDFLRKLDYKSDAPYVFMSMSTVTSKYESVPVPVIAVVKELPDLCSFVTTPYFYEQRGLDLRGNNPFSQKHTKEVICYTQSDSVNAYKFKNALKEYVNKDNKIKKLNPEVLLESNFSSYLKGWNIRIVFSPECDSIKFINDYFSELSQAKQLKQFNFIQLYNFDLSNVKLDNEKKFDYVSVNFYKLENIRQFKDDMSSKYGINIDINQVEAKENFSFISKLTFLISIILIGFSVTSITFFVSNLLKKHLEKIKMNIGTFKAFGLDNNLLKKTYISIIYLYITISMMFALFMSYILGISGGIRLLISLFAHNLEKDQSYFHLLDKWTFISIFAILFICFISLYSTTVRILSRSPGDLIYNRD